MAVGRRPIVGRRRSVVGPRSAVGGRRSVGGRRASVVGWSSADSRSSVLRPGRRSSVLSRWSSALGRRSSVGWSVVSRRSSVVVGRRSTVVGRGSSVIGPRSSVGRRSSGAGRWSSAVSRRSVGGRRSSVVGRRSGHRLSVCGRVLLVIACSAYGLRRSAEIKGRTPTAPGREGSPAKTRRLTSESGPGGIFNKRGAEPTGPRNQRKHKSSSARSRAGGLQAAAAIHRGRWRNTHE